MTPGAKNADSSAKTALQIEIEEFIKMCDALSPGTLEAMAKAEAAD